METLKKDISSVLIPSKDGVPSRLFGKEYSELIGAPIVPSAYGYKNLHDLMRNIPDTVKIIQAGPSNYVYKAVGNAQTAHITQMVVRQKRRKKNRSCTGGGPKPQNWGGRRGGSGDAASRQTTSGNRNINRKASGQNRIRQTQPSATSSVKQIPDLMSVQFSSSRVPVKERLGPWPLFVTVDLNQNYANPRKISTGADNQRAKQVNRPNSLEKPSSFATSIIPAEPARNIKTSGSFQVKSPPGPYEKVNNLVGLLESLDMKDNTSTSAAIPTSSSIQQSSTSPILQKNSVRINKNNRNSAASSTSSLSLDDVSSIATSPIEAKSSNDAFPGKCSSRVAGGASASALSTELTSEEKIPRNLVLMNFEQQTPLIAEQSYMSVCCFVESPDTFFVHLTNDLGTTLNKIRKACERAVDGTPDVEQLRIERPSETSRTVRKNEYVILKDAYLNHWCRARIDSNFNQFLVDYGYLNSEFQPCYRMPRCLYSYPQQGYQCKIAGVLPVGGQWSSEAIELFKSETEFQRLHIKVQNVLESGVCEVDIFSEEDENLGHLLCAEGFAKRQQKIIEGSAKPSREQLPNLKGIHVRVVCIDSPCSLHVNLMASSNEFECLVDEMLEYGTQNCDSRSLVKEASVGQYYLCQDEDQEYFRVQVLEVDGPNVFVEYMDFGEKDYLPFSSRLYPMKTSFFDVPFQGIHVLPNDFMQCSNEEEVMGEINKYLLHKELLMDVLHVDDNYDDDDVASPIVTFCDLDDEPVTPQRIFGASSQVSPGWVQKLEERINSNPDLLDIRNFISLPEPNKMYIAFNPEERRFCRATLIDENDEHTFTLNFVDYGTTLVVPKYLLDGASFQPDIAMNLNTGM